MSIHAACLGRTVHPRAFTYMILTFTIKYVCISSSWNLINCTVCEIHRFKIYMLCILIFKIMYLNVRGLSARSKHVACIDTTHILRLPSPVCIYQSGIYYYQTNTTILMYIWFTEHNYPFRLSRSASSGRTWIYKRSTGEGPIPTNSRYKGVLK